MSAPGNALHGISATAPGSAGQRNPAIGQAGQPGQTTNRPARTNVGQVGQASIDAPGARPRLRPYQLQSLEAIEAELQHRRSTLVVAATGTGKTVTFAASAHAEVARGGRVLILVGRDELVGQSDRKCRDVGLSPDIEKGKRRAALGSDVVLASVQSLRGARLQRWPRDHFTRIICDEAHHGVAASFRAIFDWFESAKLVGFTATPDRGDNVGLGQVFESVAFTFDIRRAIAGGYLVPIVARRVVVDAVDLSTVATRAGDFAQDQLAAVMADERAIRGAVVPLLELAGDRLTIGFCVNVAHAAAVAAMLNEYRPGCARAVSGKTDDDERAAMLKAHARGEFQFLMNCDLLVEGYDCPEVSCVAMLRPTRSRGRYVQCAGRGLRPAPHVGKRDCLLLDLAGHSSRHRLVGPVDCLSGTADLADDERDEIERLLSQGQIEIESVVEQAKDEIERRRAALRIAAVVKYHAEHVDPFIGDDLPAAPSERWADDLASDRQRQALGRAGLDDMPEALTKGQASRWLGALAARTAAGLATFKQVRTLRRYEIDGRAMTFKDAKDAIDRIAAAGWRKGKAA